MNNYAKFIINSDVSLNHLLYCFEYFRWRFGHGLTLKTSTAYVETRNETWRL